MQFIDLKKQYQRIKPQIDAAVQRVLDHGQFIMGPEVREAEQALADYVGAKHCVMVSSGTTALHVALMALGIQPGDEVVTTPFSFFATSEIIAVMGAKPIYVDIDPKTYNLDPNLLEQAITDKTKVIIPVSLYGQAADMDAINAVAAKHGIPVLEDAAQSFGARYKDRCSCNLAEVACTSFFPAKTLGAYGDAGACFTNDDELAHKLGLAMNHGQESRYHHVMIGINGRCDTLQAAILLEKLKILDDELAARQQVATWYTQVLGDRVVTPYIEPHNVSAWAQYTVRVANRAAVQAALQEQGIPSAVHYPLGLHQQPIGRDVFASDGESFVETEKAAQEVMSLPFHPYLQQADVQRIADVLDKLVS